MLEKKIGFAVSHQLGRRDANFQEKMSLFFFLLIIKESFELNDYYLLLFDLLFIIYLLLMIIGYGTLMLTQLIII